MKCAWRLFKEGIAIVIFVSVAIPAITIWDWWQNRAEH